MPIAYIAFNLFVAACSVAAAWFFFRSYQRSKNNDLAWLALAFFFLGAYGGVTALPPLFAPQALVALGVWRIVGVGLAFGTILSSMQVRAFAWAIPRQLYRLLAGLFSLAALATLVVMAVDFRLPEMMPLAVMWNPSPLGGWIGGLASLSYGFLWAFIFFKNSAHAAGPRQRLKLHTLAADGVLLGVAGFLAFLPAGVLQTLASLALFVLAGIITVIMLFITAEQKDTTTARNKKV